VTEKNLKEKNEVRLMYAAFKLVVNNLTLQWMHSNSRNANALLI